MKSLVKRFWSDEQGMELSEYAVMVGLVLVVAILVILGIGTNINRIFGILNTYLTNVKGT